MAILDHTLPLRVQAPDMMGMLDRGSQIAQFYTQQKSDGELNRLYKEANGDLNKMMEIGKTSPMARFVMPQLQAQQAAKDKADLDAQKTQADIAKTQSETLGNNDKVAQSRLSAMYKAIGHAAMTGDKNAAIYAANAAQSAGAITPEQYTESIGILNSMDSVEKIKQYATSVQQMLSQDPAKFNSTTADNRLDNETSRFNNEATVGATLAGQQVQKEIANDKLEFDKGKISPLYTEGQAALKNGAKFETIGGVTYIDLGNGKGIPYVDQDGKPLSATSKANGVPKLSDNALKQVNEASTQLSQARQSYTKIGGLVNDLKSGKLDLSASNIVAAKGRMALGLSTPNDLAIDRFQAALNQAANDVLMMAKGTQTEGDAQRAVATITANPPRDNNAAMQALNTLAGIQRNTINTLNGSINTIYDNYGIARPGINKPSQNGGGSPANNTGGRSSLSSILFE